jgi:hypothetical protein
MAIDDRPRKKKKQKSNAALWIGLGVGAGVFAIIAVVLVVVFAIGAMGNPAADAQALARRQAARAAANQPADPPPAKPAQPNHDKVDIGEKKRDNTNIRLRIERTARLNELRQIGLFYTQYRTEFNKPPPAVQDFVNYIKRDAPAIVQAIDEKYYVVLPKVSANSGIVAYERDPDSAGRHGVVDSSGAPRDITTDELVAAVKSQGK